ncbi:hypothetical protein ACM66B_004730 [Microbotryomycetes sp. NB124-2]
MLDHLPLELLLLIARSHKDYADTSTTLQLCSVNSRLAHSLSPWHRRSILLSSNDQALRFVKSWAAREARYNDRQAHETNTRQKLDTRWPPLVTHFGFNDSQTLKTCQLVPFIGNERTVACAICDLDQDPLARTRHRPSPKLIRPLLALAQTNALTRLTLTGDSAPSDLVVACLGPQGQLRKQLVALELDLVCCSRAAWEWVLQAYLFLPLRARRLSGSRQDDDDDDVPRTKSFATYRKLRPTFWPPSSLSPRQRIQHVRQRAIESEKLDSIDTSSSSDLCRAVPFDSLQELNCSVHLDDQDDLRIILASNLFPKLKKLSLSGGGGHRSTGIAPDDVDLVRRSVSGWVTMNRGDCHGRPTFRVSQSGQRVVVEYSNQSRALSLSSTDLDDSDHGHFKEWTFMSCEAVEAYDQAVRRQTSGSSSNGFSSTVNLDYLDFSALSSTFVEVHE